MSNKINDKESKEKYRKWCCWELNEEEILHVAEEVLDSKNPEGLITDDEMEFIVKDFKKTISAAFVEWEETLKEIVKNNTVDSDKRMINTFKRELNNINERKLCRHKQFNCLICASEIILDKNLK